MNAKHLLILSCSLSFAASAADAAHTYGHLDKPDYKENQKDVAKRIAFDGERAAHRGDAKGVREAESARKKAHDAETVEQARQIEKVYNKDNFN